MIKHHLYVSLSIVSILAGLLQKESAAEIVEGGNVTISINSSYSGMNTVRNISLIQRSLTKTMQKLSSGQQVNSADDGPANLVISEQMRSQIGTITQQIRNLEANLNKNGAADAAIGELNGKVAEMRSLAVAAANDATGNKETAQAYQQQIHDLAASYNEQVSNTRYGEQKLLDGSEGSAAKLPNLDGLNVSTPEDAADAIKKIDDLRSRLNSTQSSVGATSKNEYESTIRSLEVASENMSASESAIRDTDYAKQQADLLSQMIQMNSGLAVMSQGNLVTESVFKLLHA